MMQGGKAGDSVEAGAGDAGSAVVTGGGEGVCDCGTGSNSTVSTVAWHSWLSWSLQLTHAGSAEAWLFLLGYATTAAIPTLLN